MGYCIPIVQDKVEDISSVMQSIGVAILHSESRTDGVYFVCKNPKLTDREWTFSITHEKKGSPTLFKCRLSQVSKLVVRALTEIGFFQKDKPAPSELESPYY